MTSPNAAVPKSDRICGSPGLNRSTPMTDDFDNPPPEVIEWAADLLSRLDADKLALISGNIGGVGDPRPVPARAMEDAVRAWRDLAVLASSMATALDDAPWADDLADVFAWLAGDKMREARDRTFTFRLARGCGGQS